MHPSPPNLSVFFGVADNTRSGRKFIRASEKALNRELKKNGGGASLRMESELRSALSMSLDVSLGEIFARAWLTTREVLKQGRKSRENPGRISLVTLGKHAIASEHHPTVEVLLAEHRLIKFVFDVKLELAFETAVVRIQNGKIWEITSGTYRGHGDIAYNDATIYRAKTKTYVIPASIRFDKGLKIPTVS